MVRRILILVYGMAAYALFLVAFLYGIGFIGGFLTPTSLDGPRKESLAAALGIDLSLMALFALQHSGMARPAFKRWWTRIVPEPAERSTYVLLSSIALLILFWFWRPIGGVVWETQSMIGRCIFHGLFAAGLLIGFVSTFLINHFDLFGLRHVWLQYRSEPYKQLQFATPMFYRLVRHPLYVGWLLTFWATPRMTLAHLLFASVLTAYILIAIRWEERDLVSMHPEYDAYRRRVPMLVPRWSVRLASLRPLTHAADLATDQHGMST